MSPETWEALEEHFRDDPPSRAESVPASELDEAAKVLSFELPSDYREFVCRGVDPQVSARGWFSESLKDQ